MWPWTRLFPSLSLSFPFLQTGGLNRLVNFRPVTVSELGDWFPRDQALRSRLAQWLEDLMKEPMGQLAHMENFLENTVYD